MWNTFFPEQTISIYSSNLGERPIVQLQQPPALKNQVPADFWDEAKCLKGLSLLKRMCIFEIQHVKTGWLRLQGSQG